MAAFQLVDSQQDTLSIAATDKKGNPVTLPSGSITWGVDNPNLLGITPSADKLSCLIVPVGPLGTATVSVKIVDGSGNTLAAGSLAVEIVAGAASVVVVTPGAPVDQP